MRGNVRGAHFFRLTRSDIDDIRRMTLDGICAEEIARWIGCSKTTVRNHRKRLGLKVRIRRRTSYSPNDDQIIILMRALGRKSHEIARLLGRTTEAVQVRVSKLKKMRLVK